MDASITRRDFLGSALLASRATALNGLNPAQILATAVALSAVDAQDDWTGYGGVGEYSRSNGNTFATVEAGHKMRDGGYEPLPPDYRDRFRGIENYFDVRSQAVCGGVEPTMSPNAPIVLTLKVLYSYPGYSTEEQGHRGRGEMITTPFREYERKIRQQFTDMFAAAGFDAERDIAGIVLNRWGHAYLTPQPEFFFERDGKPAPRDVLRAAPFGRIAFANMDLAGAMDHRYSILEAHRAVEQLLDQVVSRAA